MMALALWRFYWLKEFLLLDECEDGDHLDNVTDALIGHTGLLKLTLSVTELRRKDCAALALLSYYRIQDQIS